MSTFQIVAAIGAAIVFVLYLARRRARLNKED